MPNYLDELTCKNSSGIDVGPVARVSRILGHIR
jgi:hypothetical protein